MKLQLQTIKEGALPISDYLQKTKAITDHLAASGHAVLDDKVLLYILGGLGLDYDALVTSITTRIEPTDLDELHGFLLSHELRLEQCSTSGSSSTRSQHGSAWSWSQAILRPWLG